MVSGEICGLSLSESKKFPGVICIRKNVNSDIANSKGIATRIRLRMYLAIFICTQGEYKFHPDYGTRRRNCWALNSRIYCAPQRSNCPRPCTPKAAALKQ